MTIYRDSFMWGMVEEVSLERRMVRFKIEDSTTDVIRNAELVPVRERTWSERVKDSDVGREEVKEEEDDASHKAVAEIDPAVKLEPPNISPRPS